MIADLSTGAPPPLFEALRLPDLKLVTKADKSNPVLKTGMLAKAFRKHDAPVPIDGKNLDVAVKRDRLLVPLV